MNITDYMMQFANYIDTETLNVNGCKLWKCGEKVL